MNRYPLLTKLAAIGLVMLLLMTVLMRIDGLVGERRNRQWQATAGVEQSLAGAQQLVGPLLLRQCTETWDDKGTPAQAAYTLVQSPRTLAAQGDLQAEARYRGLFKVNGYSGRVKLQAEWTDFANPQSQRTHARLDCAPPQLLLATSDVRGLRSAQATVDGQAQPVQPGTGHATYPRGLHVDLEPARIASGAPPLVLTLSIDLVGNGRLGLVPAAAETTLALKSDWPHPSFGGRFLPSQREVTARGFQAQWTVSALASSAAADVQGGVPVCAVMAANDDTADGPPAQGPPCLDTMDVAFIDPVNPYVLTDRATKYAFLFIALTFGCTGVAEVVARRRVHPVQYALVGLALALFFLLLLSLSEHLPFGVAYAAASAACVGLLGFYARHMLGDRRAGAVFGFGVAALYGALWVLLQLEQTALVIGSVLIFALLSGVMVATRRVDWYALGGAGDLPRQPA